MSALAQNQSRMFRTIVLMGSSLALSCGGKAGENAESSSAGSPSAGASAAGGPSSAGGAASAGASSSGAPGGGASSAGAPAGGAPAGGASAAAGAGGSLPCPPAQWTCAAADCVYDNGWSPTDCKCDSAKPKARTDCKADEVFVCLGANTSSAQPYGFDCECVPSASSCSAECRSAFPDKEAGSVSCDDEDPSKPVLCGCAIVLLK